MISLLLLSSQHIAGLVSFAIFPLLVAQAAQVPPSLLPGVFSISFLALAVANILQANRFGPVGTGYLVPSGYTAAYLAPCLGAAKLGGMPLVVGMTIFCGTLEIYLSVMLRWLHIFFPREVLAVVLILVGYTNGVTGIRQIFESSDLSLMINAVVATLAMFVGTLFLNTRSYAVLIGVIVGYTGAWMAGALDLSMISQLPWLGVPHPPSIDIAFDPDLAVSFAVVTAIAAIKQAAFVERSRIVSGAADDPMANQRGVLADGLGTLTSGILGGIGVNASASSSGLIAATGNTDRRIAYVIAAVMLVFSILPKLGAFAAAMPRGTAAGILVFTAVFVIVSGIKEVGPAVSHEGTVVIGLGVLSGLAADAVPALQAFSNGWVRTILSSTLATGTVVAIIVSASCSLKNRYLPVAVKAEN